MHAFSHTYKNQNQTRVWCVARACVYLFMYANACRYRDVCTHEHTDKHRQSACIYEHMQAPDAHTYMSVLGTIDRKVKIIRMHRFTCEI